MVEVVAEEEVLLVLLVEVVGELLGLQVEALPVVLVGECFH